MRRFIYIALLALAIPAAALLCGCHHEMQALSNPYARTGILRMQVECKGEYKSKADLPETGDFRLLLSREEDDWTSNYDRVSDIPAELRLAPGIYHAVASSRDTLPAAFDQPIYKGETIFEISPGIVTPVTVKCTLANMKVEINLSERFLSELSDYRVTMTNAPSWDDPDVARHTLVWDNEAALAGKTGYFTVAPLLVKVYGHRAIDGGEAIAEETVDDVEESDYHMVNVDAVVTGQAGITIVIDDSVNEKSEDVVVPGWSETPVDGHQEDDGDNPGGGSNDPATAPQMFWDANPDFEPTPIAGEMDINILIQAPEKIATFVVTVDSYILSDIIAQMGGDTSYSYANDGPYDMDLIGNVTLANTLASMIPTGDALKGQTEVLFSLSQLVPMIQMFAPTSGSEHIFTLKVSDEKGQTLEKSLTFYAQ